MKLIYRLTKRLAIILLPIMLLWAVIFYYAMVNEINDETDDSLEDYAALIVQRILDGDELPSPGNGSNNTYSIEVVPQQEHSKSFEDREVYIPQKGETEPARTLTMVFNDRFGITYRLTVSTPTFERNDVIRAVLLYLTLLYVLLLGTVLLATTLVFRYTMRPLYSLLKWLDKYRPGDGVDNLPTTTSIIEFQKLTHAARTTILRAEEQIGRQKQFIGNASHELQTPLAILGTRIEWLIDNTQLTEEQFTELTKMRQSLHRLSRLNRTLLLLSKIDNGQFPDRDEVDIATIAKNELEIYSDIFADKGIHSNTELPERFIVKMDESLATTLVTNLLKNAFLHTEQGGKIDIGIENGKLTIGNSGSQPLDSSKIFDRFYTSGTSGSTGLGLALVKSIADFYNFGISYRFNNGKHLFEVKFRQN